MMMTNKFGPIVSVLSFTALLLTLVASEPMLRRKDADAVHSLGAPTLRTTVAWWGESNNVGEESLLIDISDDRVINGSHDKIYKKIRIQNESNEDTTYTIASKFWNEAISPDSAVVAVSPVFPGKVKVGAGMERAVSIVIEIQDSLISRDVSKLGDYDGRLEIGINGEMEPIHLPWHFVSERLGMPGLTEGLSEEATDVKYK